MLISAGRASQRLDDKGEESSLRGRCCRRVVLSQRSGAEEFRGRRSLSPSQSPDEAGASTAPRVSGRRRWGGPILPGGKGWKGCRGAEQLGGERGLPPPRRLRAASGTRASPRRQPRSLQPRKSPAAAGSSWGIYGHRRCSLSSAFLEFNSCL